MSRFSGWDKNSIGRLQGIPKIQTDMGLELTNNGLGIQKDGQGRKTHPKTSTNELTKAVLNYLRMKNYVAWRQNNNAVWDEKKKIFRSNSVFRGVPDIIALSPEGKAYAFEIKTGKDKLSVYQEIFRDNWEKNKGVYIIIQNIDNLINLAHK